MLGLGTGWGRALFTKSRLNVLLFLWLVLFSCIFMALSAACIFLCVRYWWLPTNEVKLPVDFIAKPVKTANAFYMNTDLDRREQIAMVNLEEVVSLVPMDYTIDITLKMPKSAVNREAGNFAIRGILSNRPWTGEFSTGMILSHSQERTEKMCLFPYQSQLIRLIESLVFSPLYLLGLKEESVTLNVRLWEAAKNPLKDHPFLLVNLDKPVWISSASLTFTVRLQGVSYLLHAYPISTFILGTAFICEVELLSAALALLWYGLRGKSNSEQTDLDVVSSTLLRKEVNRQKPSPFTNNPRSSTSTLSASDRAVEHDHRFSPDEGLIIPKWFSEATRDDDITADHLNPGNPSTLVASTEDISTAAEGPLDELDTVAESIAAEYKPLSPAPSP